MSRLEKSTKTIAFNFANTMLTSVLGFISRTVFVMTLGAEYLGLAGLLSNVLGFLSISELGIAMAIGFSLYKPLANNDNKTVSALMSLYRKAYLAIAGVVFIAGCILYLSLDFFVPPEQQPYGTSVAYFAFLIQSVVGYLLSYKTTLISSDNKAFKLAPIIAGFSILTTVCQIIALVLAKNYIIYIVIQITCSILQMLAQNKYITKHYPNVDFYSKDKLDEGTTREIKRSIGGLVIAKIGDYLVNSTDNLIITKLVSLAATGIYSNYLLIRNIINGIIATVFGGVTASLGNIIAVETDQKKLESFETLFFIAFLAYSFESVCFICLFNPFIGELWLGKEFVFGIPTVVVIVLNNYLTGLRIPLINIKNAAGKFMEDAWVPFAFAGINLVASIILAKYFGVTGVFLGTIIGSMLTADWYRPVIIYKHVFHTSVINYFKKYITYIFLGGFYMIIAYMICNLVDTPYIFFDLILKGVIAAGVPIILSVAIFYRTKEYKIVKNLVSRVCNMLLNTVHRK